LNRLPDPPLLLITDRSQAVHPLIHVVREALAGGCRWVSLREKDMTAPERRTLLGALLREAQACAATATVHDDVDAASAEGAAGVHLPRDGSPSAARRALGPDALIGQSCHSSDAVRAAQEAGADYVTLSPVFGTHSKPGYRPIGIDALAETVSGVRIPVVALGGVSPVNAAKCMAAGAAGVAVMGDIMRAPDPAAATRAILAALG